MSRSYSPSASALALTVAFISLDPPQAGPVQELPTVEVDATRQAASSETAAGPTAVPQSLTVATPEAAVEALRQVPGGTNFIDANFYEKGRAANLDDVLRYQPMSNPTTAQARPKSPSAAPGSTALSMCVGSSCCKTAYRSRRCDGDYGWIPARATQCRGLAWRQRAAVRRSDGAINFVSPTGYTAAPFQSRFEAGSFGYYKGQLSSGQVLGNFDYASVTGSGILGAQRSECRTLLLELRLSLESRCGDALISRLRP